MYLSVYQVEKVVPDCQHEIKIECCLEPLREHCYSKCNRLLPCGHQCDKQCNEPCTDSCKVLVDCSKQSPCGHIIKQIRCYRRDTGNRFVFIVTTYKYNPRFKYCFYIQGSAFLNSCLNCKNKIQRRLQVLNFFFDFTMDKFPIVFKSFYLIFTLVNRLH